VVSGFLNSTAQHFDEDIVLIERFLAGDAGAFNELYSKYYERIFSIARGILLDHDEAADATQEIFALIYRNLNRFDRKSKFSTWMFRVAVNRSIQQGRGLKYKHRQVELNEASEKQVHEPENKESDPRVTAAMEQLQPVDRAVLTLFYWEELSLQEVADSLHCGVNAAKTRLFRARERFRKFYERLPE